MVKFYIYNTSNGLVLDLFSNRTHVIYKPFNGRPTQQWEFTPSLLGLGWTLRNVETGTYLQPSARPPWSGLPVVCSYDAVTWKFKSVTVVPRSDSVFTLEYDNLAITIDTDDVESVILRPTAGQTISGTQVWQCKSV